MSGTAATSPAPGGARAILTDVALNVALPYGAYALLRHAGYSEIQGLLLTAAIPASLAVASAIRRRRMNFLSLLVLAATALSLGATLLSGSAWFALIQPSFVSGMVALIFLASLVAEKPALFYLARDTTCPTPEEAADFEGNWVNAPFRKAMRRLTLVWAAFLGGEALLRAVLAAIWPSAALVAATQILWIVLPVLLVRWSIRAGRRWGAA